MWRRKSSTCYMLLNFELLKIGIHFDVKNTIYRRRKDISLDIQQQLEYELVEKLFTIQLDEAKRQQLLISTAI